jgi:hypothetical protein
MKKLLLILCLILATMLVNCSTGTNPNSTNATESAKKDVATNLEAEIDRPIASTDCPEPGYDKSIPEHKFSCEYQLAILKFAPENIAASKDKFGNWFGRVVAFGYVINVNGTKLFEEKNDTNGITQDEFRRKLREGEIRLIKYSTNFNKVGRYDPQTKAFDASVEIEAVGLSSFTNGVHTVTYKVKDAGWEATEITIK